MQFTINDQKKESAAEFLLLTDVLASEKLEAKAGIAVAVNQEVIPRSAWSKKEIKQNDQIIIIKATQGG